MSNSITLRFLDTVLAADLDHLADWIPETVPMECLEHLRYLMWARYRQSLRDETWFSEFQSLAEVYKGLLKKRVRNQYDQSVRTPAQELKYWSLAEMTPNRIYPAGAI